MYSTDTYAPICLFCFDRPNETLKTITALSNNLNASNSEIFVFLDGPKECSSPKQIHHISETKKIIESFKGNFKYFHLIERENNLGLASSIIKGVSDVINDHYRVIVFEDDLVSHHQTLNYFNEALSFYKDQKNIFSISGYNHPPSLMHIPNEYAFSTYLSLRPSSWGWATWKENWMQVDWNVKDYGDFKFNLLKRHAFNNGGSDMSRMLERCMKGKINSWAIRWSYHHYLHGGYCVYPVKSLVDNIGFDNGTHCSGYNMYANDISYDIDLNNINFTIKRDEALLRNFKSVYSYRNRMSRKLKVLM